MSKKRIRVKDAKNIVKEVKAASTVSEDHVQETTPVVDDRSSISPHSNDAPDQDLYEAVPPNCSEPVKPGSGQEETSPVINQYSLSNMSLVQKYSILSMLVYADCAVKLSPDNIFDVLARNFDSPGLLSWWLHRIGHGDKAKYAKGRDLIEYIRKIANELYRDLKNVGKPVARF